MGNGRASVSSLAVYWMILKILQIAKEMFGGEKCVIGVLDFTVSSMLLCNLPLFFKAVATIGFIEQRPFGILPSVFELAPGQAICVEVGNQTSRIVSPLFDWPWLFPQLLT